MRREVDLAEYKQIVNGVLSYMDTLCRKEAITYYLAYGTLLGAVRHKGFIPWDDDVDVIMDRNNFIRFIEAMRRENHPYYKLMWLSEQKDYDLPLPKVVDARTKLKQAGRKSNLTIGAWVDILIIDDVPNDPVKQEKAMRAFDRYEQIWAWSQYRSLSLKNATSIRSFVKYAIYRLLSLRGSRYWAEKLYRLSDRYNGKNYDYFSSLLFSGGKRKAYRKEWLGNGFEVEFEGKLYIAPENWDAYLKNAYGDYMILPPKEKQISNHKYSVYYKD